MNTHRLQKLTDLVNTLCNELYLSSTKKSEFMEKYRSLQIGDHLRILLGGYPNLVTLLAQAENQLSMNDMIRHWNGLYVAILQISASPEITRPEYETVSIHVQFNPVTPTAGIKSALKHTPYVSTFHWQDDTLVVIASYDKSLEINLDGNLLENIEHDLRDRLGLL